MTKKWHQLISHKNKQKSLPPLLILSALFINLSSVFSSTGDFIRTKKQRQASVMLCRYTLLSWWWLNWWTDKYQDLLSTLQTTALIRIVCSWILFVRLCGWNEMRHWAVLGDWVYIVSVMRLMLFNHKKRQDQTLTHEE